MRRIGLISDTHDYLDTAVFEYFQECDEIWHAGDIGLPTIADDLAAFKPFKAVFGNIDGQEIRFRYPEHLIFDCEGVKVLMIHIGGYPGKYKASIKTMIEAVQPKLFICGHSHILKVIHDSKYQLLHINPGAAGNYGFHLMRTIVRFSLHEGKIQDMEVIELGKKTLGNI
jgi:putative phosphoesterase